MKDDLRYDKSVHVYIYICIVFIHLSEMYIYIYTVIIVFESLYFEISEIFPALRIGGNYISNYITLVPR